MIKRTLRTQSLSFGLKDFDFACNQAKEKSLVYEGNWYVGTYKDGSFCVSNYEYGEHLQQYKNGKDVTYLKSQVKNFKPA